MSNNYPPQGGGQPNQPPSPYQQGPVQNQPPAAPGYYAPPPPPGAYPNQNPYGAPPNGQPYPPAGYPAQVARPARKKGGPGGIIALVVIVVIVGVAVLLGVLGVFNNVDAADYPGATKATLTDKGTTYVNGLYNDNSSDRDNRKVFLTSDTPDKVFQFYKDDLTKKGWTFDKDGQLDGIAASQFSKNKDLIIVIAGGPSEGLIKDEGTQNFIIVVTGQKV